MKTPSPAARPWLTVLTWLVIVLACAPFALKLESALQAGGFTNPAGEASQANRLVQDVFGGAQNTVTVSVSGRGARSVAQQIAQATRAEAGVRAAHVDQVSPDGQVALVQVELALEDTAAQNLVPTLRQASQAVAARTAGVQAQVTGAPALDYALNVHSKEDATRAEMIAFPALLLVLLLAFRSLVAAGLPLMIAGVTMAVTQALGYLLTRFTDLNTLFTNAVSMIGLAVAVDYALFIVQRYREELAAGRAAPEALKVARHTAGHAVLFSGVAVIVALVALFIPGITVFRSIALGGILATSVAVLVAMTLLPAVLTLLGARIHWGQFGRRGGPAPARPAPSGLTAAAMRAPATVTVLALAGILLAAAPLRQLNIQVPVASAAILPAGDDARRGVETLEAAFGLPDLFPVQVVIDAPSDQAAFEALTRVHRWAETHPLIRAAQSALDVPGGLTGLRTPQGQSAAQAVWRHRDGHTYARAFLLPTAAPDSADAHRLVRELRSALPGSGDTLLLVTGATAAGLDFDQVISRSAPLIVGVVAALTFLVLFAAFRSVTVPLLALAFNSAVVLASLGLLTFLVGRGESGINSVTPLVLYAVMFGLSMDYMVIMLSRVRELREQGLPNDDAIRLGIGGTSKMVTSAALIMLAVFLAFGSAQISIVRQLGYGLAMAVALDAFVMRPLVLPAVLKLAGHRVWRAPARPVGPTILAPGVK